MAAQSCGSCCDVSACLKKEDDAQVVARLYNYVMRLLVNEAI